MTTKKAVIVGNGEDWEGVYINGKLVTQDHHIRADILLEALGYKVTEEFTEEGWLEDVGYLPENIEDVKFE